MKKYYVITYNGYIEFNNSTDAIAEYNNLTNSIDVVEIDTDNIPEDCDGDVCDCIYSNDVAVSIISKSV